MDKYDVLKLDMQVCFPLYAASREVTKNYVPLLNKLNVNYTQYIVLLALWEHRSLTQKKLCEMLFSDSETLTPALKGLEAKGLLRRKRSAADERVVEAEITEAGMEMRDKALDIPPKIAACVPMDLEDAKELHRLLYKLLYAIKEQGAHC